ncbi:MAG: DUF1326 domain-containing protein [Lysobacterales bacterium]|nr:MAG: DUF1326 domain-containing protein [Xanthomonadales bacterium]
MTYQLKGRMLEVCTCNTVCPCFVGEAPDGGACDVTVAWHMDKGTVEGVDVTGRTVAAIAHIPGKPLDGNWRAAVYIDDGASDAQQTALLNVFTGKLGGPIADVAKLIGEVVGVERVPITFVAQGGKGSLKIGEAANAEMEPYVTAGGTIATLSNTLFSGAQGAPALLGRSPRYRAKHAAVGIDVDLAGHSAVECSFVVEG